MSTDGCIVVVGGTAGIGRELARYYAGAGRETVLTGRDAARAENVAADIGGTARGIALDLAKPKTIREALRSEFATGSELDAQFVFARGCGVDDDDRQGFAEAVEAARAADVAVVVVGDQAGLFGRGTVGEGCDRDDLELPGVQRELVEAVLATGKPVVLVLVTGRPYAVAWALEAAERMAAEGRSIEVVDLRTLLPWDRETVLQSVRKTGRALVLHEAPTTGGFGGELAAVIGAEAFDALDAPVSRLGALDTPVPFSKALEEVFSPRARLLPALRALLAY
jgi:hypothetical protein